MFKYGITDVFIQFPSINMCLQSLIIKVILEKETNKKHHIIDEISILVSFQKCL